MRKFVIRLNRHEVVLDVVGTGGTTKILLIYRRSWPCCRGLRVVVANTATARSSLCGSADVLEQLGINVNMEESIKCMFDTIVCFSFAQRLHPHEKVAGAARARVKLYLIY